MDAEDLRKQIQNLLWKGNIAAASRILADEGDGLKDKIDAAQADLDNLKEKQEVINQLGFGREEMTDLTHANDSNYTLDKAERNQKVIDVANRIAADGVVRTSSLAREIAKERIDLGVPSNRTTTALSNILLRTGKCKKIASGIYRLPEEGDSVKYGLFR